jgi:RND family efflux transporter MFP subunit
MAGNLSGLPDKCAGPDLAISPEFASSSTMHRILTPRIPGILTLLVSAFFVACSPDEKPLAAVPPVQTFVIAAPSEAPFRRFPGEVSATRTTRMSFEVPGRLIEFPATQGLVVKQGDLLGRLDDTNFVSRLDAARAQFTNAQSEFQRRSQLRSRGVISQSEFDQFKQTFDVAEAALREAQRAMDETRMIAPIDGRVARTLVNNFQNVQAKEPVLVFQDISMLEVDIQVPESDMFAAERGVTSENARNLIEAAVEFPALPGSRFDLDLKSFSTEATPASRTFRVTFFLKPQDGQNILPGMTCTVLLRLRSRTENQEQVKDVFEVPVQAVSSADEKTWVWRLDPKTLAVQRVAVQTLGVTSGSMQVQSSQLTRGDELVSSGVRFLSDGMTVRRMAQTNP